MSRAVVAQDFVQKNFSRDLAQPDEAPVSTFAAVVRQLVNSHDEWQHRALTLLGAVGQGGNCRGCNAEVFWVRHANGKTGIYDPDGASHFGTCPEVAKFRRKG